MRRFTSGFSLVELMVSITVMGILAAIIYANVGAASPKARDAERQADLRYLQSAIEQFKQKNGRYPVMGTDSNADGISSEAEGSGTYIVGLAPEFISVLPKDTRRGSAEGYAYSTNADVNNTGTSYKVMALGTVESETVTALNPMKRCDNSSASICSTAGVCSPTNVGYQKTYALWGGFANGATDTAVKTETAKVICK